MCSNFLAVWEVFTVQGHQCLGEGGRYSVSVFLLHKVFLSEVPAVPA